MKLRSRLSALTLLLLSSTLTAFFAAGCSKPDPPPMATQTPEQMNQSIKDQAAKYKAYRESHPNAYQTPSGGQ